MTRRLYVISFISTKEVQKIRAILRAEQEEAERRESVPSTVRRRRGVVVVDGIDRDGAATRRGRERLADSSQHQLEQ